MYETIRKKLIDGYEHIEYLYLCEHCDYKRWSTSKNLFMSCPACRGNKIKSEMRLAI